MVKMNKYPDDKLIEYLMNEGDPDFRSRLSLDLETDTVLADRLAILEKITSQLRQLPLETFYSTRNAMSPFTLLIKAVILTGIFFTGVLVQSEFSILNRHVTTPATMNSTTTGGDYPFSPRVVM